MKNNQEANPTYPIHQSLIAEDLNLHEVPPPIELKLAIPDIKIIRCQALSEASAHNYYHLSTDHGNLFAKIKAPERAIIEKSGIRLTTQLAELGVLTPKLYRKPITLQNGNVLFLYLWCNHSPFASNRDSILSLSENLALLHKSLRKIDYPIEKSIADIFFDNANNLTKTKLAPAAEKALLQFQKLYENSTKQLAHNDIHIGNVLFNNNKVVAFIDFEDSLNIASTTLIDIAATIERFILCNNKEVFIQNFLISYARAANLKREPQLSEILIAGRARCYNSLGILSNSPQPKNHKWIFEWKKFIFLLERWQQWENSLGY